MGTTESDFDDFLNLEAFITDVCSPAFQNLLLPDVVTSFSTINCGPTDSQNLTPKNSTVTATIDSQSSIYGTVGSPVSANKPSGRESHTKGTTSGLSDPSDEDDEIGPCEQSTNPLDMKRLRRKVSNCESARRSRRRKQVHLSELETQVEKLKLENACLYKQFTNANQQYYEADTNNRVLKSDVEALRAKIKLAEDMVTRSSFNTLNNQLVQQNQCQMSTPQPPQLNGTTSMLRMAHVSPTINVLRGNGEQINSNHVGFANLDMNHNDISNSVLSNAVNCVTIWQ